MKKIAAATLLLLILYSCKKNTANPVGPVGLLNTYSVKTYSVGNTVTTNSIATFYYDNQQRVVQATVVLIDSANYPVTKDTSIYTFSYFGTAKSVSTYTDQEGIYVAFHTLGYDAQNRPVLDSITNIVPAYSRTSAYIASNRHVSYPGNMSIGLYTYYDTHALFEIDSVTLSNLNPIVYNITEPGASTITTASAFGASLDPLYAMNISPILALAKFSGRNLPVTGAASYVSTSLPPFSSSFTYQYLFNENGQLIQASAYAAGTTLITNTTYQYQ